MSPDYFYNLIAQTHEPIAETVARGEQPLFDPNFLNLEYFFNLIFRFFDILAALLAYLAGLGPGGGSPFLRTLFWIIVFLLLAGIVYAFYKHKKIQEEEQEKYLESHYKAIEEQDTKERNERWEKVLVYLDSLNESDWRLAIIEADSILGEMLERMQYSGESIGEKLKGIERSDFLTLNQAWEAHKVRNQIAHEGASFRLSKREAERVVELYRKVFEEFGYI